MRYSNRDNDNNASSPLQRRGAPTLLEQLPSQVEEDELRVSSPPTIRKGTVNYISSVLRGCIEMPVVVYKEDVMGRRCAVAFQIDRHRALQYYAGRITKYRCEMELVDTGQDEDDNKRIAITCEHHICFEDGDEVWVDLADQQRSGNLK
jgi:hypothetical protein